MTTLADNRAPMETMARLRARFGRLYGERADDCMRRTILMLNRYAQQLPSPIAPDQRWTQADNVLVTYADSITNAGERPLRTLNRFLTDRLGGVIDTVHILPFFPWSSDDGFSVIDYRKVNPDYGSWSDVTALGQSFRLMFDLVLNHCSRSSEWFRDFTMGVAPGRRYFHVVEPGTDLSAVVRPRRSPVLHPMRTRGGERWVWTTFSDDQIDLNFANPDVLLEFLDILLLYVRYGARIVRLDAIAFLWKQIGTSCLHLPQTHEVVKVMRDVLEIAAPHVVLLTETNVPHQENIGYFGAGDEAHMVYNFSLPPLLLHAMQSGSGRHLTEWAATLGGAPPGCTFLNFTASHDGIGVRPLEGIVSTRQINAMCDRMKQIGGHVSQRSKPGGGTAPYELNITWFDAMTRPGEQDPGLKIARFLCSQTVPMAMAGVPAVYVHSLVATPNDEDNVTKCGYPRAINRRKWDESQLTALLNDPQSTASIVFTEYARRLRLRSKQPAFHPDAAQRVLDLAPTVFAVERVSVDGGQSITAVSNLTDHPVRLHEALPRRDLMNDQTIESKSTMLAPYQTLWLTE